MSATSQLTRSPAYRLGAWFRGASWRPRFTLRAAPDQGQLFTPLFEYAGRLDEGEPYDAAAARAFVRQTVQGYLTDAPAGRRSGY